MFVRKKMSPDAYLRLGRQMSSPLSSPNAFVASATDSMSADVRCLAMAYPGVSRGLGCPGVCNTNLDRRWVTASLCLQDYSSTSRVLSGVGSSSGLIFLDEKKRGAGIETAGKAVKERFVLTLNSPIIFAQRGQLGTNEDE